MESTDGGADSSRSRVGPSCIRPGCRASDHTEEEAQADRGAGEQGAWWRGQALKLVGIRCVRSVPESAPAPDADAEPRVNEPTHRIASHRVAAHRRQWPDLLAADLEAHQRLVVQLLHRRTQKIKPAQAHEAKTRDEDEVRRQEGQLQRRGWMDGMDGR